MVVYRFRITFEEHDEVYREIEIKTDQTFEDFNNAIQQSIGFDNSKKVSFFMSNDLWKKGQEISNIEQSNGKDILPLQNSVLSNFITDPHQKIYLVIDTEANWTFYIELVKIVKVESKELNFPSCTKSIGAAPKQYAVVEPHKGTAAATTDLLEEEILAGDDDSEPEDTKDDDSNSGFGEMVNEEEYDNIEERSSEGNSEESR